MQRQGIQNISVAAEASISNLKLLGFSPRSKAISSYSSILSQSLTTLLHSITSNSFSRHCSPTDSQRQHQRVLIQLKALLHCSYQKTSVTVGFITVATACSGLIWNYEQSPRSFFLNMEWKENNSWGFLVRERIPIFGCRRQPWTKLQSVILYFIRERGTYEP